MTSHASRPANAGPSNPPTTQSATGVRAGDEPLERLAAAAVEEMAQAAGAGRDVRAETWFARHPAPADREQSAVRLVFEEICLREEQGERVVSEEIYARFPRWKRRWRSCWIATA